MICLTSSNLGCVLQASALFLFLLYYLVFRILNHELNRTYLCLRHCRLPLRMDPNQLKCSSNFRDFPVLTAS
jgi:hypothetical protein